MQIVHKSITLLLVTNCPRGSTTFSDNQEVVDVQQTWILARQYIKNLEHQCQIIISMFLKPDCCVSPVSRRGVLIVI